MNLDSMVKLRLIVTHNVQEDSIESKKEKKNDKNFKLTMTTVCRDSSVGRALVFRSEDFGSNLRELFDCVLAQTLLLSTQVRLT